MVQFGDAKAGWAIPVELWKGLVREVFERYEGSYVAQNMKFDVLFLRQAGIKVPLDRVHDTRAMGHILDPTRPTGLKPMAVRYIDPKAGAGERELKSAMAKYRWTWRTVPWNFPAYAQYAALDSVLTASLYDVLWPRIESQFRDIYDLELASTQVLTEMEWRGIRCDLEYCRQASQTWGDHVEKLRAWCRDAFGISNPTSNREVMGRLASDGVTFIKTTPTGQVALTEDVLSSLDHPLAKAVIEIRKYTKLKSSYTDNFIEMVDENSFLHPQINPLGARTGRMSITNPALQTLPRGREVRDAFIPRDGHTFLIYDYDQIELRLLAHFSQDTNMIRAIKDGLDLHTYTASQVYGVPAEKVTKAQRQIAKNASFARAYGAGLNKFAMTAEVDLDTAKFFYDNYNAQFPGVNRLTNEIVRVVNERARSNSGMGWVVTPFGRRHPVDPQEAYKGLNFALQGSAADVLKRKIVDLDIAGVADRIVLPVHDELIFDVPDDELDDVEPIIASTMAEHAMFTVPLTVTGARYNRWGAKYAD